MQKFYDYIIMCDKDIIEYYKDKYIYSWNSIPEEHKKYLKNRFNDSESFKESVWRILYNIEKRPTCKICGAPIKFVGRKNNIFSKTCSKKCTSISIHNFFQGYKYPEEQKEIIRNKIKSTLSLKYGDENYNNRAKAEKTCLEKYGVTNYAKTDEGKQKIKNSMLNKYGVEYACFLNTNCFKTNNPQKNPEIKEKTKQTNIKRYGGPSPTCDKKIYLKQRETQKKRSGEYFWINTKDGKEFLNNLSTIIKSKEVQEKIQKTCLEKYGVSHYSKTNEYKNRIKEQQDIIIQKINSTKKKNNSFNTSSFEEIVYIILLSIFKNVKRNYNTLKEENSNRYPFNCDFYIPEIDTFIEIQGSQFHHGHPFNINNKNDILELNRLIEKSKKSKRNQYISIIDTWTKRDPIKREYAIKNNLNYIEFWNITEVNNWIEKTILNNKIN